MLFGEANRLRRQMELPRSEAEELEALDALEAQQNDVEEGDYLQ